VARSGFAARPYRAGCTRAAHDLGGRSVNTALGVCVCGGASRRMGRDKAGLSVGGATMLASAIAALSEVAEEVVLATGQSTRYPDLGCRVVLDRYADAGPLAGLEAGLSAAREGETDPRRFVAVLPCDMPRAGARLLRALLERARRERDVAACLLASDSGPEPLCGVYHARALDSVRAALDDGERKVLSFARYPAASGALPRVVFVPLSELCAELGIPRALVNVNTPEDLAAERAYMAAKESA
jgi:molybdenum cofactor guanylyltransferase